jgi:hypothetical protein
VDQRPGVEAEGVEDGGGDVVGAGGLGAGVGPGPVRGAVDPAAVDAAARCKHPPEEQGRMARLAGTRHRVIEALCLVGPFTSRGHGRTTGRMGAARACPRSLRRRNGGTFPQTILSPNRIDIS